jgi:hypothetical protein
MLPLLKDFSSILKPPIFPLIESIVPFISALLAVILPPVILT